MAGPFDEVVKEALGVAGGMGEDLPAQEAVFRGEVALDVDEAQDPTWVLVCQQQPGQAAHGMPDKVEAPDSRLSQHCLGGLDQERDGYFWQGLAGGLPASRCVVARNGR